MPQLLHEYWQSEQVASFGPVQEEDDLKRPLIMPGARLVFSLWASSWEEAMQARNDKLDWGQYTPVEGFESQVYSEGEAAIQRAYLSKRAIVDTGEAS